jgi:undecaprenyl-diphosphatase
VPFAALRHPSHPLADRIRTFDRAADRFVGHWRRPALDHLFYPLSSAADHSLLWVALGSVREAIGKGKPGSAARLTAILAVESAVTNGALKSIFKRIRPALDRTLAGTFRYGLRQPVTSAFPSGHATSAFTAAAYLSKDSPLAPAYYGLAVLVSASRVYVKLHHASDVVGGAVIGIAFGHVARQLAPSSGSEER